MLTFMTATWLPATAVARRNALKESAMGGDTSTQAQGGAPQPAQGGVPQPTCSTVPPAQPARSLAAVAAEVSFSTSPALLGLQGCGLPTDLPFRGLAAEYGFPPERPEIPEQASASARPLLRELPEQRRRLRSIIS